MTPSERGLRPPPQLTTATFIETNAVRQAVEDNAPFPASGAGSFDIQRPG